MDRPDDDQLAAFLDRVSRGSNPHREGVTIAELPVGWARLRAGSDDQQFASVGFNRIHWQTATTPLSRDAIDAARGAILAAGCRRAFVWLHPRGWTAEVEAMLARAGAAAVPHVRYLTLARRGEDGVEAASPHRRAEDDAPVARALSVDEAEAALRLAAPWYSEEGARIATRLARAGVAEIHAAFVGERPVGISALIRDAEGASGAGRFGYLGWTGVEPAFRGRGAQRALIESRVAAMRAGLGGDRRAAHGAWCVSETNTAVETSLRNLSRCGFTPCVEWRVYRWDVAR